MKVLVSGQHMDLGDSLRTYIEDEVTKHVNKYFDKATSATVTLTMEKQHYIRTDILINQGTGTSIIIKSHAHDGDAYKSFDEAMAKANRQLNKHKSRLKDHQKINIDKLHFTDAKKYVISPISDDDESAGDAPAIIAEKVTSIKRLSIGDAVMRMDLENLNAYLFVNSGTNRLNMVYYRDDGNIAWIDVPSNG